MKFGKITDTNILEQINWTLPHIDQMALSFLSQIKKRPSRLLMGAPAWNHKEWLGKIYPPKTKAADYLFHYSRYFNTIELNTTHYRIPDLEQTQKWCEQVPSNFLFCPKVFQGISHERGGLIDSTLLKVWFQFLENLKGYCGPCFIQLPPNFDYSWKSLLFKFLQSWPSDFKLALEFRHPSWFQNGVILPALVQYLQSRGIGLVITDVAGRRDVLHGSISTDFMMVRFVGNELHDSDYQRAQLWNKRLLDLEQIGLSEIIFFVHEPDDILIPEMATYLRDLSYFKKHLPNQESSKQFSTKSLQSLDLFKD